jgi:hypothetical protein
MLYSVHLSTLSIHVANTGKLYRNFSVMNRIGRERSTCRRSSSTLSTTRRQVERIHGIHVDKVEHDKYMLKPVDIKKATVDM